MTTLHKRPPLERELDELLADFADELDATLNRLAHALDVPRLRALYYQEGGIYVMEWEAIK